MAVRKKKLKLVQLVKKMKKESNVVEFTLMVIKFVQIGNLNIQPFLWFLKFVEDLFLCLVFVQAFCPFCSKIVTHFLFVY